MEKLLAKKVFWLGLSGLFVVLIVAAFIYGIAIQKSYNQYTATENKQRIVVPFSVKTETQDKMDENLVNHQKEVISLGDSKTIEAKRKVSKDTPKQRVNETDAVVEETVIANATSAKPTIAIIIRDLGLSKHSTELAMTLPSNVTLGFSPYAHNIDKWYQNSHHEILLNLPMEPLDYPFDDPGPYALLTGLEDVQNQKNLEWVLSRARRIKGVYTDVNEKFTHNASNLESIFGTLHIKKMFMVYGGGYSNNHVLQVTKKQKFPLLINDLVIDDEITKEAIEMQLSELENLALKSGKAIAIGRPYPLTLDVIKEWMPTLKSKGIELVPVSQLQEG